MLAKNHPIFIKTRIANIANSNPLSPRSLKPQVVRKNSVTLKCWDIGGQKKYRQEWSRYTSGCDVILFVVDVSDFDKIPVAKEELKKVSVDCGVWSVECRGGWGM